MTFSTAFPVGDLAAVRQQLHAIEPRLHGVAAESAREALAVLDAHPAPDAPEEARRAWAAKLMDALNELVRRAPESEAVLDLAERAQRAVGRA
jgi:truncated hemoglobin YjbI